ncbi:MAG: hypothetical protein J6B71_00090 [Clostridia bacterium]|nr:hypothetical protein [Clostridia bacterium]
MGKGSRNRQIHLQDRLDHPEKYKEKKQAPKWLTPLISIVLLAAIVIGVFAYVISANGIIQRGRILIESQSGKFDVNQQMATFIAWQSVYSNSAMYWTYCSYGLMEDTYKVTTNYKTADEYALTTAQYSLQNQLRDCIDDVVESLKIYVAVCDAAYAADKNCYKTDAVKAGVKETIAQFDELKTTYGYTSVNGFLKMAMGTGMKESDIEKALTMLEVYDAYCTEMQVSFETATTLEDLKTFRDANPKDYYKTDYLTFAADNKELADQLKACTTPEEFKALVLSDHFANNYKTTYNKYTTQVEVADVVANLKNKTDANGGTALTAALDEYAFESTREFLPDATPDEDLKKWLFDSKRKQYETGSVETEDGIYVVTFFSEAASETSVTARYKFYEFDEGEAFEDDVDFKNNILKYIQESKKDEPSYPEVAYKTDDEKADALEKLLKAEGANIAVIFADYETVTVEALTSSDKVHPEALVDAVFEKTVKTGDVLNVDDNGKSYVIYVEEKGSSSAKVTYATLKNDLYFDIIDELTASLNKVYPTDKTANYDPNAKADTFEAWISAVQEGTLTSVRTENETKTFETTKDEKTTYNVYMVINTPMYLDTNKVVYGAYYLFSSSTHAADAEAAKAELAGKTYAALANGISALGGTSTYTMTEASLTDANLKTWMFSADRKANDVAVIANAAGTGSYIAAFVETNENWYNTAKNSYVTDKLDKWMDGLAANYTVNEKALDRIGEASTDTVATTAATTTAA